LDTHTATSFGISPFAVTDQASNVTIGGITRGSGVTTTGSGAARGWGGTNWNSTSADGITGNQFITFTVQANSGYKVSLSAINKFDYRVSPTGPTDALIQYSVNGTTFTDIATANFSVRTSTGGSVSTIPISLSGISSLQNVPNTTTITIRIVPYGATGPSGTFYIWDLSSSTADDFALNGSVAVYTPPAYYRLQHLFRDSLILVEPP